MFHITNRNSHWTATEERSVRSRKTPLCRPLQLQAEKSKGGERRRTKTKVGAKMKDESQCTYLTGSSAVRAESKFIYTSVKCADGR